MTELASLVGAYGPWIGLLVYGALAIVRDRQRRDDALERAHAAHAEDLRKGADRGSESAAALTAAASALATVAARLQRVEDRLDASDSDPGAPPPTPSRRGR